MPVPVYILLAWELTAPLGLDSHIPAPEDNPLSREKAELGQALFDDAILSRDRRIACSSCHQRRRAFTDDRPLAVGIEGRKGTRRTPAILNRAYGKLFFWDGRVKSLEEQVLQPIANPKEMDLPIEEALKRLEQSAYAPRFEAIFGRRVNQTDLARALATYVRTILAGDSPYDRWVAGDRRALSAEAVAGMRLFRGKAGCIRCHVGVNLTDERLHNTGAGQIDQQGRFKTPSLREVARRAPYMHDGSMRTLEEVIDFYDQGGKPNPNLDPEMRPLRLTPEEKRALKAFLEALSGTICEGWTGCGGGTADGQARSAAQSSLPAARLQ